MPMITCGEFAKALKLAAFEARNMLDVPMEELMVLVREDAKRIIGNYQANWPQLAESTIEEKTKLGYAPPDNPLLREGTLRESIKADASLDPTGAIGVVGSEDKIALYQEMGTSRIPPRPFLANAMVDAANPAVAEKIFGDFLVATLTKKP